MKITAPWIWRYVMPIGVRCDCIQ